MEPPRGSTHLTAMKFAVALLALPLLAQPSAFERKEQALGQQIAKDIRSRSKPLELPPIEAYVNELGKRLVPEQNYRFEVVVIDATEPIAVLGGTIFVPASLLATVQDEAELNTQLAHAIGHIALRHGLQTSSTGTAAIPLIFVGGWTGFHGRQDLLVPQKFREQQRTWETEADVYAAELTARDGVPAASDQFRQMQETVRASLPPVKQRTPPTLGR